VTDAEIKKALEELLELMLHEGDLQRSSTISNTLDLLNRKDAEIERLKAPKYLIENSFSEKEISEILKSGRYGIIPHINFTVRRIDEDGIKAEAYKDLAEKLKAKKKRAYFEGEGFYWCVTVEDIDEVLKEVSSGESI
jgi:hypothetical protein